MEPSASAPIRVCSLVLFETAAGRSEPKTGGTIAHRRTKLPLCFFGLGLLDAIEATMRKVPKECGYARICLQVRELLV
jgi:hypothetical protein